MGCFGCFWVSEFEYFTIGSSMLIFAWYEWLTFGFFTGDGTSSETFLMTFSNKDNKFSPPWDSTFFGTGALL